MAPSPDGVEYARLSQRVRSALQFYMNEHGVNRAQLARQMQVTPGRVSQLLSGDENLTLKTLTTVATCLGARFELSLVPIEGTGSGSLRAQAGTAAEKRKAAVG